MAGFTSPHLYHHSINEISIAYIMKLYHFDKGISIFVPDFDILSLQSVGGKNTGAQRFCQGAA